MRDDYVVVIPNPARDMHVMRDTLGCAPPGAPDDRITQGFGPCRGPHLFGIIKFNYTGGRAPRPPNTNKITIFYGPIFYGIRLD